MSQENRRKNKKTMVAVVSVAAVAVVLFVCIFSLYHLPERDPVETPVLAVDDNDVSSPAGDMEETIDIDTATSQQVSSMLGDLEMQYQNASINGETYEAQQNGLRLALAYIKTGQSENAEKLLEKLMASYSYDTDFVAKCKELEKDIK